MFSWLTLLIPCRCFGNKDMGKLCPNKAMKLDPHTIAGYALMSSMYAESHILEAIYLLITSYFGKISGLYCVADMLFETNGRICCYKRKQNGKHGDSEIR